MEIKFQPMGATQTNCYIVTIDNKDLIIDPGTDALGWIKSHTTNPIAILNTHGHYDHVWSNHAVKTEFNIPLYIQKDDDFMLTKPPLGNNVPPSKADYLINGDEKINIQGIDIQYRKFAGHTPGNSIIEIGDVWFSGDFLFRRSIGRWDFPFSSADAMVKSLEKAMKIEGDFTVYPGHDMSTTLKQEQKMMPYWIETVKNS